ncbi:MAG: hypothetical protein PHR16_11930 [Methylovulum sp.]|nr:hypothetical protein [Methylovulum sp.]
MIDKVLSLFSPAWLGQIWPSGIVEIPLREAYGESIDADDSEWRRLTGDGNRDLAPMTQKRMQDLACYLWQSNPVANRLIELPTAFLLADGVKLVATAEDPDIREMIQDYLTRLWLHPTNNFPIKLARKVRELAIFGEQCWPAFTNPYSGEVRLGYLDPSQIETVVHDPDNAEQPIGIVTKRNRKGEQKRYKVIVNGRDDDLFTPRTIAIRDTFTDGDCFWFVVNALCTDTRGRSDLLPVMDWCDAYEQQLYGEAQRQDFLRSYVWDVTLKGGTEEDVKKKARTIAPPAPGTVRVHNDSEIWAALTPNLQATDNAEGARLFRNHILGGQTMPEHWFGGGGDVNRSTGDSMSEPTVKALSMRQAFLGYMLLEVARYTIRKRELAVSGKEPDLFDPNYGVECQWPEMAPKDISKFAASLQQVVMGCSLAIDKGLLSKDTAIALIGTVADRLGLKIDPALELEKAAQDSAKAAETDAFQAPAL